MLPIKMFPHGADVIKPFYATPGSAGLDIHAAVSSDCIVNPGVVAIVPTGFALELPIGTEAQIRTRSGLALKQIIVLNAPGTIDSDFRDEVKVILMNVGTAPFTISKNMRIAQMVISKYERVTLRDTDALSETSRKGGFGSTGL